MTAAGRARARSPRDQAPAAVALVAALLACLVTGSPAQARSARRAHLSPRAVAAAAYARLTRSQRVGQLFMAGVAATGATSTERAVLGRHAVGNVFLRDSSNAGRTAVARVTRRLRVDDTIAGVHPFVATDQEGGEVQRLTGPGFSRIPTALRQGQRSAAWLRTAASRWGRQLAAAGVTVDLAPVADVVPAASARSNAPIGRYDREYGHTPAVVARHVTAFVHGMAAARVATTVKHFPGLGRSSGNTDTTPGVTDPTTRRDPYLRPFRRAVEAGAQLVMVSAARYPHIDPARPACFSPAVVRSLLRGNLGFRGVVLSDSMDARAVAGRTPGRRAIDFLRAGGHDDPRFGHRAGR